MENRKWQLLQRFAEGEGGEGTAGETAEALTAEPAAAAEDPEVREKPTWEALMEDPEYAQRFRQEVDRRLEAEIPREHPFESHYRGLEQQAIALQQAFPEFSLQKELQNPAFVRLTAPGMGVSVEDAYFALHRRELQQLAMEVTAQATARKISNSIQAGMLRPAEAGAGQGPSMAVFDYRAASPQQKAALKKRILDEAAQGRKVYPNG